MNPQGPDTSPQSAELKTLLFTDLVDSTKLAQQIGDERMAEVFILHDRLARDLLQTYEGQEADRTDGFMMLFERPINAVRYALAFHQAMTELSRDTGVELAFRVGIHLGEVVLVETPTKDVARGAKPLQVEGLAKPTAARLMSLAQGGQILLSQEAYIMAKRGFVGAPRAHRPVRWVEHGHYRLKGVAEPVAVFEVGIDGLTPFTAPPDTVKVKRVVADRWTPRRRPWGALIVALALTILLGKLLLSVVIRPAAITQSGAHRLELEIEGPPGVVILGFESLGEVVDGGWVATAMSELLAFELSAIDGLTLVSPDDAHRLKSQLGLGDDLDPGFDTETLSQVWQAARAHVVVVGTYQYYQQGQELQFSIQLHNTQTADRLSLPVENGQDTALPDLAFRLASRLVEALDIGRADSPPPTGPTVLDGEAAEFHAQGMAKLRVLDALAARNLFQQGLAIEPSSPRLHAALGEAMAILGYEVEAEAQTVLAIERAASLGRGEQLLLRTQSLQNQRRWKQAWAICQALWLAHDSEFEARTAADRLDLGLRLAELQTRAGKRRDGLATLEELRLALPPASEDPRIDLIEARVALRLPDYQRQLTAARRAIFSGERQNTSFIGFEGRHLAGVALRRLNRLEEAQATLEEARSLYAQHAHVKGQADAEAEIGIVLADRGDTWGEQARYDQAARLYEAIGNQRMVARIQANKAQNLIDQGNLRAGEEISKQVLEIFRQVGDREAARVTLVNLQGLLADMGRSKEAEAYGADVEILRAGGTDAWALEIRGRLLMRQGDLQGAGNILRDARAVCERTKNVSSSVRVAISQAQVLYHRGDLEQAIAEYRKLLLLFQENRNGWAYHQVRRALGDALMAKGDLAEAEGFYLEAIKSQSRLGNRGAANATRLSLATVYFHQGAFNQAEDLARDMVAAFQRSQLRQEEAAAHGVLARCLYAQGKIEAAQQEIDVARRLLGENAFPIYQIPFEIAAIRILAGAGQPEEAEENLQRVLAQAANQKFLLWELEILLVQAEIALSFGNAEAGLGLLEGLKRRADQSGFGLIVRQAKELRSRE